MVDAVASGKVQHAVNMVLPGLLLLAGLVIAALTAYLWQQQKKRLKAENDLLNEQNQYFEIVRLYLECLRTY